MKFVRINGENPANYRFLVKVDGFPTVFIFDEGSTIEYNGLMEYNPLLEFINKYYDFTCKELSSPEDLLKINGNRFIFGVFRGNTVGEGSVRNTGNIGNTGNTGNMASKGINQIELQIETFKKLNKDNRGLIDSCHYTLNTDINMLQFLSNQFPDSNNSYILINNGIHLSVYNHMNNLPIKDKNKDSKDNKDEEIWLDFYTNYLRPSYLEFIKKNYFKDYDYFDGNLMNVYKYRGKTTLVLSYQYSKSSKIKQHFENLAKEFSIYNNLKFGYNLLLYEIPKVEDDFTSKNGQYFEFTRKTGIYLIKSNFRGEVFNRGGKLESYTFKRIIDFIKKSKYYKEEFGDSTLTTFGGFKKHGSDLNSDIKYVTAKIKSSIDDDKALEKEKKELEDRLAKSRNNHKKSDSTDNTDYKYESVRNFTVDNIQFQKVQDNTSDLKYNPETAQLNDNLINKIDTYLNENDMNTPKNSDNNAAKHDVNHDDGFLKANGKKQDDNVNAKDKDNDNVKDNDKDNNKSKIKGNKFRRFNKIKAIAFYIIIYSVIFWFGYHYWNKDNHHDNKIN